MGLTKQYLRYAPSGTFNIISSPDCNTVHVTLNGISGRYIAVGACEHVIIWDMRLGEKAQVLPGENVAVSQIAASTSGNHMAVGYVDGNIQIFELTNNEVVCVFAGHKSAVTCLQYDDQGHRLVSGSLDTEVILWDIVSETGIARFSGHKGAVTSVMFINGKNCVISASKDSFVKFWDIETKHCFKTLGGHQTEVWSAVLCKDERYLVTGTVDPELRVWKLNWTTDEKDPETLARQLEIVKLEETEDVEDSSVLQCHLAGSLVRGGRGRAALAADAAGAVLACRGADHTVELFLFLTDEEARARMEKRVKKARKKWQAQLAAGTADADSAPPAGALGLSDAVRRLPGSRRAARARAAAVLAGAGEARLALSLADNTVELLSVALEGANEVRCLKQISQPGHRREPRCVAVSSDNLAVLSAAADSAKLWNRPTQSCIRTIPLPERPTAACFAPGDRHALVAGAAGALLVLDVSAGTVLEQIPAHDGGCSAVGLTPDQLGCYSGGADRTVKLWRFELITDPSGESNAKVLSLLHTRTLQLEEPVTAARASPDGRLLAVALLDATVKIFYYDTFKFYLSLYGHKLPVLCLDISYDSTLVATGSADRNVKLWGLDFGDCHRSIFAHNDSITSLQFVPNTHYFFTSSKDGRVKQWDGDTYDNIATFNAHAGACWGVALGAGGLHAASCGADRALRLLARTDEPLVLEDAPDDEELATGEKAPVPGLPNLNLATRKTIGAEKAADSLLECLELGLEHKRASAAGAPPPPPALMQAYGAATAEDFLLETVRRIRASDLEEALLLLPFSSACELLRLLPALLQRRAQPEALARLAVFLLRVHHKAIVANGQLLKTCIQIQARATMRLQEFRDTVGENVHALRWLAREAAAADAEVLFRDAVVARRRRDARRKAREAVKRPIVTVT